MAFNSPQGLLSPVARTTYYYSTMYMVTGALAAYLPIWLTDRGFSEGQIGWLNSLPILVVLLINILVGRIADRLPDWRTAIIAGSVIAGAMSFGLLLDLGFYGLLLVWTLSMVPFNVIVPVTDAATIRMTRRTGQGDFSVIRAWGTVGHTAVTVITGYLVAWFSGAIFVPLIIAIGMIRAGLSLQLPRFRGEPGEEVAPAGPVSETSLTLDRPATGTLRDTLKPWFVLPILGAAIVFATHLVLMSFGALVWKNAGIEESMIGVLIAIGAGAEAIMMFAFRSVSIRFSARSLMLFAAIVAAIRWGAMALEPPLLVLIGLQLLHSITFAVNYLGAVNFIANWTSEEIAAEAQSFFVVMQQAVAVLTLPLFGLIAEFAGAHAFFAASALAALAALFALVSLRMQGPRASD